MSTFNQSSGAIAVLDTNVILDWLVFDDPTSKPLARALSQGGLQWIGTQAMKDELAHVLSRQLFHSWAPDEVRIWKIWDQFCTMVEAPMPTTETLMRCTDIDDQKFIDLALSQGQWLFSRDHAILRLTQRAKRWGVQITTPEKWGCN